MIAIRGMRRAFGSHIVLDGIDIDVAGATVGGILGPNGAGKTTTIEALVGLASPDAGSVRVDGRTPAAARGSIGYAPQSVACYPDLSARENVRFFAALYGRRARDADAILARVGLADRAGANAAVLSGGQQRMLNLALALAHDPPVVVLDEPTVGLDIEARELAWRVIRDLRAEGRTVVLTTHYLEEAERLCDRVAILARGRIVREGTPADLIAALGYRAVVTVETVQTEAAAAALATRALDVVTDDGGVRAMLAETLALDALMPLLGGVRCTAVAVRAVGLHDVYRAATAG